MMVKVKKGKHWMTIMPTRDHQGYMMVWSDDNNTPLTEDEKERAIRWHKMSIGLIEQSDENIQHKD